MADAVHRLALILEAKNQASKELQQVRGDVGALGGGLKDLYTLTSQLAPGLNMLLTGGLIGGGVMAGRWLWQTTMDLSATGAAAERTATAFERRLGGDATAALEALRTASQGTIADLDLMEAATRAQMLGVADDAETLAGLLEVAAKRGRDLGMSTADAFSDLVTGIGRLSPELLDNLSIMVDAKNTYDAYAVSVGKTADALTNAEKRQALVNRVLQEATGEMGELDAAGKLEAQAAAMSNLRVEAGRLANELLMESGAIEGITEAIKEATSTLDARHALSAAEAEYTRNLELGVQAGALSERQAEELRQEAHMLAVEYVYTGRSTDQLTRAIGNLNENLLEAYPAIGAVEQGLATLRQFTAANAQGMYAMAAATEVAASGMDPLISKLGEVSQATLAAMDDLKSARALLGLDVEDERGPMERWVSGYLEAKDRAQQARDQVEYVEAAWNRERERAAEEHASTMERIYQEQQAEMRSMAEALLTPTTVTGADMFRAQTGALGGYVDKWDESARRLEDIANRGAASPWWEVLEIPEEVLAQGEEAVRLWARETADAVQGGLRPDLIDWGAFDLAAEQYLRDQAAREQTLAMAMQRLGGTAPESEVRAMLGMPADATQEAMAIGAALQEGMGAVDLAGSVTHRFIEDLQAHYEQWRRAGTVTIGYFAEGLEGGLSGEGQRVIKALWPWLVPALDRYFDQGVVN